MSFCIEYYNKYSWNNKPDLFDDKTEPLIFDELKNHTSIKLESFSII